MQNKLNWFSTITLFILSSSAAATLKPFTSQDCKLLASPKSVLLVHATWCSHCQMFKPVYEKVASKNKYNAWTFYEFDASAGTITSICGVPITAVPLTFKNNMQTMIRGAKTERLLENFLDY